MKTQIGILPAAALAAAILSAPLQILPDLNKHLRLAQSLERQPSG